MKHKPPKHYQFFKGLLKNDYIDTPLPPEFVMAYFVPEEETIYEVTSEYRRNYNTGVPSVYIESLIKLKSYIVDDKFLYREVTKVKIDTGEKIRRVSGNLQDFIGKKIFRTQWESKSEFYINFPKHLIEKSKHRDRILEAFKK